MSPSYSPEQGPLTRGASYQVMLVREPFGNCLAAAEALDIDPELRATLREKLKGRSRIPEGSAGRSMAGMPNGAGENPTGGTPAPHRSPNAFRTVEVPDAGRAIHTAG